MPIQLKSPVIETERLILRPWKEEDREHYFTLSSDEKVMEYFPNAQMREEADAVFARIFARQEEVGQCFPVVEEKTTGAFLGFCGLSVPRGDLGLPVWPTVEIGWRLHKAHWGKGITLEAAKAWLDFAFHELKLEEVIAYTAHNNMKSRRVMEKLGMSRNPSEDFRITSLERDHRLNPHVLYRLSAEVWREG